LKWWIAALAYMALIFYLSSMPAPDITREVPIIYRIKLVHIVEYGILGALLFLAARETMSMGPVGAAVFAVLAASAYGISDEVHQLFVPMRSASAVDVIADALGAALAQLGLLKLKKPVI